MATVRSYAAGLGERIAAARRIHAAEETILLRAMAKVEQDLAQRNADGVEARGQIHRELQTVLRAVTTGMLRDDLPYFRETFGEWLTELFLSFSPAAQVKSACAQLRVAVRETLDAIDERALQPYLNELITQLDRAS